MLQLFDLLLILLVTTLKVFLMGHRKQLGILILRGLAPSVHLFGDLVLFAAVATEFRSAQSGGLQHGRQLVGRSATLRILLESGHHRRLQPQNLMPL